MRHYYDFIVFLAFRALLNYENKRCISFEDLCKYHKKIVEKHINYHSQFSEYDDEDFERHLHEFHDLNNNMALYEERDLFVKFIQEYSDMFYFSNGRLCLNEDITIEELEDKNFSIDCYNDRDDKLICGELLGFHDCPECLDIIGANSIKKTAIAIVNDEKKIEKAYKELIGTGLETNIQKLLNISNYKLALIGNLPDKKMNCYHRLFLSLSTVDSDSTENNIDLYSDELMEKDEFYKLNEQYNDLLAKYGYIKAIFGKGTLSYDKLSNIMDTFWTYKDPDDEIEFEPVDAEANAEYMAERERQFEEFDDEFADEDEEDDDYDEDEDYNELDRYLHRKNCNYAFYLYFINNIDKYIEIHGDNEDLNNSKNRLLYLLDGYGDNLYIKESYNNSYNNISMDDINYKDDMNDFYTLSRLFLVDILEGWNDDELTLKKLLFVSSYYNLTKDERIERIIEKYKDTKLGQTISNIIMDNNYNILATYISNNQKKLNKEYPNNQ